LFKAILIPVEDSDPNHAFIQSRDSWSAAKGGNEIVRPPDFPYSRRCLGNDTIQIKKATRTHIYRKSYPMGAGQDGPNGRTVRIRLSFLQVIMD
jgi:hypothetical protein